MKNLIRILTFLVLAGLMTLPVGAQDSGPIQPTRDTTSLARRLLGFSAPFAVPLPSPIYHPGDRLQFWVSKQDSQTPTQVNATLLSASDNIYLWVEDSVSYAGADMDKAAAALDNIYTAMRLRDNYGSPMLIPGIGPVSDPSNLLTVPDVDNDPHLYILYAADLATDQDIIVNPNDSLPVELTPGGFSNQHEVIMVNTSLLSSSVKLDDGLYLNDLARAIFRFVMDYQNPNQAPWLKEALANYLLLQFGQNPVPSDNITAYFGSPGTPLIQPVNNLTIRPALGAQLLFLSYVQQRYGEDIVTRLFTQSGDGLAALNTILSQQDVTDPISEAPVTAADAFADFAMTNGINDLFGDGRYFQSLNRLTAGQLAVGQTFTDLSQAEASSQTISQYGTYYMRVSATANTGVTLTFHGNATVPRLPMPSDRSPEGHFYWSGDGWNNDNTLTRPFDLTGVQSATLTFDAWYDLSDQWNYAYVEVSADNGQTWKILPFEGASQRNLYGLAYGQGFTGISNPQGPRPFPVMGVVLGADGVTVGQLAPGGPAEVAGVQPQDVIIGYDNHLWDSVTDVLGLLAEHTPGDTLNLYVQRGSDRLNIPVVLGAHPTRRVLPPPLWLPERVDLTPYAGKQILLRFEYVSVPGQQSHGLALDNIAVPEIGFSDDAESGIPGWTLDGWQQTDNQLRQRFLLETATTGTSTRLPAVRILIGPEDTVTDGQWNILVAAGEQLVVVVSGLNENTDQPATFDLKASPVS